MLSARIFGPKESGNNGGVRRSAAILGTPNLRILLAVGSDLGSSGVTCALASEDIAGYDLFNSVAG